VQFQKRVSHGLMAMANYTWSRTSGRDYFPNGGHDSLGDLMKQIESQDRKGIANITISYTEPFFAQSHGIVHQTLGGWNTSLTTSYQTGQPLSTPTSMNKIGDIKLAHPTDSRYFNTCYLDTTGARVLTDTDNSIVGCASDSETPAWQQLGNYDKNTTAQNLTDIRGKVTTFQSNINMSVYKDFSIRERYKATFRAEAYNVLNSPVFAGSSFIITSTTSSSFGSIDHTRASNDPRQFQFSLKLSF
jgi:hypothetical protein